MSDLNAWAGADPARRRLAAALSVDQANGHGAIEWIDGEPHWRPTVPTNADYVTDGGGLDAARIPIAREAPQ